MLTAGRMRAESRGAPTGAPLGQGTKTAAEGVRDSPRLPVAVLSPELGPHVCVPRRSPSPLAASIGSRAPDARGFSIVSVASLTSALEES
ncbi:unnamed protein product [Lota lota]